MPPLIDRALERVPLFRGQKSGSPPQSLEGADASMMQNCVLLQNQPKKVNGASIYAQMETLIASQTVSWVDYFNGHWYAQKDTGIFRETGVLSKAFDKTTLTNNSRLFSDKYKGQMFLCSGDYLYRWDETGSFAMRTWGLLPPITSTGMNNGAVSVAAGGSLTANTLYKLTLTLYDSVTQTESPAAESRPGSAGTFLLDPLGATSLSPTYWYETTTDANKTISITHAEILRYISGANVDSRADYFRIYRTDVNGDAFKLDKTVKISDFVGAYTSDQADSTLGVILNTTSNSPPPNRDRMQEAYNHVVGAGTAPAISNYNTYKHVRIFRDTVFAIGAAAPGIPGTDASSFNKFSSVLAVHEPFEPEVVSTTFDVNDGDGQLVTGIAILKDSTPVIFKQRSIYYLLGTDPTNYRLRILDSKRGCVHAGTIQETPIGIFALDSSGVILIDGTGWAKSLSNPDINDIVRRISFQYISTAYSGYDLDNEVYYLAVPVDGSSQPNLTICYSVRSEGFTYLQGLEGNSLRFDKDPTNLPVVCIGSRQQGYLLDWSSEKQVTFINNPIQMFYTSGPMYFGDPARRKKLKFLYITAESAQDWTVDINIFIDFQQSQQFSLTNRNSATAYSVYAASLVDSGVTVGIWDTSNWGAEKSSKQLKIPVYGVGYAFQVQIINKEYNANKYGFKIQAMELEAVMMGK